MMEEKNDPTYHLLLTIFCLKKYYPLLCLCFSCIVNYQKTSCIDNLYFLFLLFFQFNHFNLLYPTYFFLVFLDQNKFYFSFAVLQRILHFMLFFFKNQLKKSKIPFFLSAPFPINKQKKHYIKQFLLSKRNLLYFCNSCIFI